MAEPEQKPFLEKKRKSTDESLTVERDKTNQSISEARVQTESQTNRLVKNERQSADRITAESRAESDASRNIETKSSGVGPTVEQEKGEARLVAERTEADNAVEKERQRIDTAITRERQLNEELVTDLLGQERGKTDKNLKYEREETDTQANNNSRLLKDEITRHTKTKIQLTSRDEFLAIVSHDLRNPIGTAASSADLLLNDESNNFSAEMRSWIELIKRNLDGALRLIGDILDMERVAEGKLEVKIAQHDVQTILSEAKESFKLAAAAKKVSLEIEPLKSSIMANCDRDRINQVLSNLIGNALKFTPEGGSIVLSVTVHEDAVQFHVRDTGPGIPIEKLNSIFNRFTQLGSKDRTGLGLGLYISKMLIEAHNGQIWVDSKLGEGSTFSFSIPTQMTISI